MRGGKRYTKGVLACEIWTELISHFLNRQSGQSDSPINYVKKVAHLGFTSDGMLDQF